MSASKKAMEGLHTALANALAKAIKDGVTDKEGEAVNVTAAYLSVARQFLKDNNIEATSENPAIQGLTSVVASLPFSQPDEHGLQ